MSRLPDSLPSPVWYAWSDVVYAWKSKCGCGAVCAGGSPAEDDAHESPDAVGAALAAETCIGGPPCAPRAGVYEGLVPTAACAKRVSILYAS